MKRPFGVVLSSVLLILGSLLQLLFALLMALSGVYVQHQMQPGEGSAAPLPAWMPAFICIFSAAFLLLATWALATAVGLLKLRRWARYSVLVIGGALALIGLLSFLFMLLLMVIPLPVPATVEASQVHGVQTFTRVLFGVMAVFYAAIGAVGASWLVYFSRQQVCALFAGAPGSPAESRRPALITVIAGLSILGAGSMLLLSFTPLPAAFFGWILYGWAKAAYYGLYVALEAGVGVGLWRMRKWGLNLALGVKGFTLLYLLILTAFPGLMLRYHALVQQGLAQPAQLSPQFHLVFYRAIFVFSAALTAAILAVLIHHRRAFEAPVKTELETSAPLES